jgi:hypothetical protein
MVLLVVTKIHMMASSYTQVGSMDFKDSEATIDSYWLRTVLEDRAESAPPPEAAERDADR